MSETSDLMSLFLPTPEKAMAEQLRRKKEANQLAAANERANSLNMLEFAAQMSNNPGLAQGSRLLAKSTRDKYSPVQMGQQGFMLPETGEYTESPMYAENKEADRQQKVLNMLTLTQSANQRAAETNALRMTIAQMNDARMRELAMLADQRARDIAAMKGERDQAKLDAAGEKALNKLTTTLDKAGIPEMENALGLVQKRLNMHPEGQLPGYGRVQGAVPDMLSTDAMQQSRADMQQAANIILKSRSGAAVTEPEQLRFLREVGAGKWMDEATLRRGWRNVMDTFEVKRSNLLAGVTPDVLQEYNTRSGTTYSHAKPAAGGQITAKTAPSEDLTTLSDDDLAARIAAAKAKKKQ